jgi:hypothetical protein
MKGFRKNLASALLAGILILMLPLAVSAAMETVTGKIEGLACVTVGYSCPVDQADPMLALERDFVLVVEAGDFYLMPNLDRAVKARYVLRDVTVKGFLDKKYRSIDVEELIVDGKVVWSLEKEKEMRQRLLELEQKRRQELYRAP